jgi:hypothetical protein
VSQVTLLLIHMHTRTHTVFMYLGNLMTYTHGNTYVAWTALFCRREIRAHL